MTSSPPPSTWCIDLIRWDGTKVVLEARGTATAGACPGCGVVSTYVHDQYTRRPHDLPWRGHPVRLHLRVRRFRCLNPACSHHTFAESFDPTLPRYAHSTAAAEALRLQFGRTAGGAAGARLLACAGVRGSASNLVRLVRRTAPAATPTPRVLGVDEFSWTRRRFATVLVDLETHRPVELLRTHKAEPVITWLRQHPGVQILVRDLAPSLRQDGRAPRTPYRSPTAST